MNKLPNLPNSLADAIRYFADKDVAHTFLVSLRWPHGVFCPACNAKNPMFLKTRRIYKCRDCGRQFSAKLGTIFEDSPLGMDKWLPAIWLLANAKNGISSYEVGRALGVTQKTAWFMLHRIRLAMQTRSFRKLRGVVEADEAFIGGRAKNMHKEKRRRLRGTGGMDKAPVLGMLERGNDRRLSRIKAVVVPTVQHQHLQKEIVSSVKRGSKLYTDTTYQYMRGRLPKLYEHEAVNHAKEYVRGQVHTNGLENFWSLLKRAIKGTYVSVDPFHLFRYVDEQVHRFNNRGTNDRGRFLDVLKSIVDRRLTYGKLIGQELKPATTPA
ncbi:MAG TPA: IS1595 family transposase [Terriglobales bacterium]|nr:IS1595 family transposase [Terriglobales bacterium]